MTLKSPQRQRKQIVQQNKTDLFSRSNTNVSLYSIVCTTVPRDHQTV